MLNQLNHISASDGPKSDLIRLELRREIFRWAAERIRDEFRPETWDAFWLTAVDEKSVEEVAARLGMSCGAIYAARSRIMRRLREKVAEFEPEDST